MTAGSLLLQILAHQQHEKGGMPYSEEMARLSYGRHRRTARAELDMINGLSAVIILIGLILGNQYLIAKNHLQKKHRKGLRLA